MKRFNLDENATVLDPFCGTGTTLVEAKKRGIRSVGIEAVPMSAFAAETKLDWQVDPEDLERDTAAIGERASERLAEMDGQSLRCLSPTQTKLLLKNSISPLPLHRTLVLLDEIAQVSPHRAEHLRLALARHLPTSIGNLRFGPEIGLGVAKDDAPVLEVWSAQVRRMANDLRRWSVRTPVPARVIRGDARMSGSLLAPESIDAVITSPPYPNEKDYTRTVRLESVLLGFLDDRESLRAVKRDLVRSNTRSVYKHDDDDSWLEQFPMISALADQIEEKRRDLGKTSGFERMYHRVTRLYFGGMVAIWNPCRACSSLGRNWHMSWAIRLHTSES